MKLTGKEWCSLQVEENGNPRFCHCHITIYHLLNTGIKGDIVNALKKNREIKKYKTDFITVEKSRNTKVEIKISKGTKINMKFLVSLEEDNYGLLKERLSTRFDNVDVSDVYNYIIELFEDYAYELDTDVDNIKIELVELEICK